MHLRSSLFYWLLTDSGYAEHKGEKRSRKNPKLTLKLRRQLSVPGFWWCFNVLQCDSVSDGADLSQRAALNQCSTGPVIHWSTGPLLWGLCQIQKPESDLLYVSPELSPQGLYIVFCHAVLECTSGLRFLLGTRGSSGENGIAFSTHTFELLLFKWKRIFKQTDFWGGGFQFILACLLWFNFRFFFCTSFAVAKTNVSAWHSIVPVISGLCFPITRIALMV